MCMYFFAHAFVRDAFMFRLAPTIHCILTSDTVLGEGITNALCNIVPTTSAVSVLTSPDQSLYSLCNNI